VRLAPPCRRGALATGSPAGGEAFQVRERDRQPGCGDDLQRAGLRPQDQRGATVAALEAGAGVAGRLEEEPLVGLFALEGVRRTELVVLERQFGQRRRAVVRPPPVRKRQRALADFADFERLVVHWGVASVSPPCTGVLGVAALLDRDEGEVERAVCRGGGRCEYRRPRSIGVLEAGKAELRLGVDMLQRIDQLVRRVRCIAPGGPAAQQRRQPLLFRTVGRRLDGPG
jgi:hypothetical protein